MPPLGLSPVVFSQRGSLRLPSQQETPQSIISRNPWEPYSIPFFGFGSHSRRGYTGVYARGQESGAQLGICPWSAYYREMLCEEPLIPT